MSRDVRFERPGAGKAVLLLHGLTGSPTELVFLARALYKGGYDVHCPILPGHGAGLWDVKQCRWEDWYGFALAEHDRLAARYDEVYLGGLCLGATLAAAVGEARPSIKGMALLAPLITPDGWAMPWYRFLLPFVLYTPLKFFFVFLEKGAMGVKNDEARRKMEAAFAQGNDALDCFPLISLLELKRFAGFLERRLGRLKAPFVLFHSELDDFASIKNAEFLYGRARSPRKELVRLTDSYHMVAIDNERELVAAKTLAFFRRIEEAWA